MVPADPDELRHKKVLLVTPTFFSRASIIGGGERFVSELCRALRKYVDCRIVSFSKDGDGKLCLPDYVHTYHPLLFLEGRRVNPVSVSFMAELFDADIIHCHQVFTLVSNGCQLLGKLLKKKVFLTDLGGGGFNFYYGLRLHRLTDGFICLSKHSAERFSSTGKPSFVIYGGVDINFFRSTEQNRDRRVVCVGRITPHKGQDVLIKALPDGLGLDIIGPIEHTLYFEYLRQIAKHKDVRFYVDYDESKQGLLVQAYSSALATVLPSVYTDVYGQSWLPSPELLGLVLLESMACETPVIASDAGGMPEVVQQGRTGFLFPPSDVNALSNRLRWIRDNPEEARAMGQEGRRWVAENFTWDHVARRCLTAYASAFDQR